MHSDSRANIDDILLDWLRSNSVNFLDPKDEIEVAMYLKNTIRNDPKTGGYGLVFDHKYEIQPKAIFITKDGKDNRNLGIIEVATSTLGLKDVGVLHAYAKMVDPKYALLLCEKSYSKELTYLLTDPKIGPRLMEYKGGKSLRLLDFT